MKGWNFLPFLHCGSEERINHFQVLLSRALINYEQARRKEWKIFSLFGGSHLGKKGNALT